MRNHKPEKKSLVVGVKSMHHGGTKHSSQERHILMMTNSARIPEGGLFLKKLMLPDACLGAIKDASCKVYLIQLGFDDETSLLYFYRRERRIS